MSFYPSKVGFFCGIIFEVEDLSEIIKRRSTPGILIFDLNDRLLYSNEEALKMIPELQMIVKTGKIKIPSEIYNLCNQVKSTASSASIIYKAEHSGLHFSLRAFLIKRRPEENPTHIIVLVERIIEGHDIDFEKVRTDHKLTNRELEVMRLLCYGFTNRGISEKLFIFEYTVKDHLKKIMRKIDVKSRTGIIALLLRK